MKALTVANLLGAAALAVLCLFQWSANRSLNLEVNALERTRLTYMAQIAAQEKAAKGLASDLEDFRHRLQNTQAELADATARTVSQQRQLDQLGQENEALKSAVAEWSAAVKGRDERIVEANTRITDYAARLNESVGKFNQLAADYNKVVRQLNEERARVATAKPQ